MTKRRLQFNDPELRALYEKVWEERALKPAHVRMREICEQSAEDGIRAYEERLGALEQEVREMKKARKNDQGKP